MNAPAFKTRSEQKLEWIESLDRPLTDEESDELRRAIHAVYCCPKLRAKRLARMLAKHAKEEAALLKRIKREALLPTDERA